MANPRKSGNLINTREAILTAAADLLFAGGYENTSMDAVAASAGVTKMTVYAHFPNKLELFKAVMGATAIEFTGRLKGALAGASGDEPGERLVTALLEIVRSGTEPHLLAFYRILVAETERRAQLTAGMEVVIAGMRHVVSAITDLIKAHADRRGFQITAPEQFAMLLLRLVTSGVQLDLLLTDFQPSSALLEAHVRCVVSMFLRGMEPDEPNGRAELPQGYDYPWGPILNYEVKT